MLFVCFEVGCKKKEKGGNVVVVVPAACAGGGWVATKASRENAQQRTLSDLVCVGEASEPLAVPNNVVVLCEDDDFNLLPGEAVLELDLEGDGVDAGEIAAAAGLGHALGPQSERVRVNKLLRKL